MPRFFIDTYDGQTVMADSFGIELESIEEAADEAAALLPAFAREVVPAGQAHDFAAAVRDEFGNTVYRTALLFRGRFDYLPIEEKKIIAPRMRSDETIYAEHLRTEAVALAAKMTKATNELWGVCYQAKSILESSLRAREERLR